MPYDWHGYIAAFGALLTGLMGFEAFMEGERFTRGLILLGAAAALGWSAWHILVV